MDWTPGYREWEPPGPLHAGVACLWVGIQPETAATPTLVLPDACTDLIWQRGKGAFVAGPDTGPAPVCMPPGSVLAGVRFRPGAGGAILGVPLRELLDLRVDAADVSPVIHRRLPGSLAPETAMRRMTALVGDALAGRPPDPLVLQAARVLGRPWARTDGIARDLGISERQLRRHFDAAVGYGPKSLSRVLRFRRFLARLDAAAAAGAAADLAGIAADAGYADQPHLTRESVRLAGLPPAALARARAAVRA